jgi:hypothetical protein
MRNRILGVILSLALGSASTSSAATVEWIRQFGSTWFGDGVLDFGYGVSTDGGGNAFIAGRADGDLDGANELVSSDAFVRKYNASGDVVWTQQFGTSAADYAHDIAVDSAGSSYLTGVTHGDLAGASAGMADVFLRKYDSAGNDQWTRQFGSVDNDVSQGVALDSQANLFVSGHTSGDLDGVNAGGSDVFLAKYDIDGNRLWIRQFGSSVNDSGFERVSTDGQGNVYLTGGTQGDLFTTNLGGTDAYLTKYDAGGGFVWSRQFGTPAQDHGRDVVADDFGNVYVAGNTEGDLAGPGSGSTNAFLRKYDAAGNVVWTRQFGTPEGTGVRRVAVDAAGNIVMGGGTAGSLGLPNAGNSVDFDAYLGKFDPAGNVLWFHQLGTEGSEQGWGLSVEADGAIYVGGHTTGDFGLEETEADWDVFVAKLIDGPAGDFNGDGTVDAADYVVWRNGLGTIYNAGDVNIWRANFGSATAGGASTAFGLIPEPVTSRLLFWVLAFAFLCPSRQS